MKYLKLFIATFALMLFVHDAAAFPAASQKKQIKQSIELFNHALIQAAEKGKFDMLNLFTTNEHGMKVYIWCRSWHENGLVMHAKQEKLAFTTIEHNTTHATARTEEQWNYWYRNAPEQSVYLPEQSISYQMQYELVKERNRWIISNTKILSESQKPRQAPE